MRSIAVSATRVSVSSAATPPRAESAWTTITLTPCAITSCSSRAIRARSSLSAVALGAFRRDVRDVVDLALAAMNDHAGRDCQQQEQGIDQRVPGVLGVVEVVDHRRRDQRDGADHELPPFEPGSDGEGDDEHGERDAELPRRLRDRGHRHQGSDEAVDARRGRSPTQRDHRTCERGSDHLRHPQARSPGVIGERELGRGTTQADDGEGEVQSGDGQPTRRRTPP